MTYSKDLLLKHNKYVAGASTFSKSPLRFPENYPKFIKKASECYLTDVDNKTYIDYTSSLGAITLGYNHQEVNKAVINQLKKGNIYSYISDVEADCAEMLTSVTGHDKCLFLKTGTDAVNASLRLARAYTNRPNIAYCSHGYHGWGDTWGISQSINKGIPECLSTTVKSFEYDNIESVEKVLDKDIAAIIMEQITFKIPENKDFVNDVIKLVHDNGSLLILDNIVLFPRFNPINFNAYKSNADMVLLSKGMSNGYSISAVVGKDEILQQRQNEEVFISGTFFGETIPMIATMKTLELCNTYNLYSHINGLNGVGYKLQDGFNRLCEEKGLHQIMMNGLPFRMKIDYYWNKPIELKTLFMQELAKEGILFGNVIFPTLAHTKYIVEETLEKCDLALDVVASAIEQNIVEECIEGRLIKELNLRK